MKLKDLAGRPIYRLGNTGVGKDTTIYLPVHDYKTSTLHDTQTIRDNLLTLGVTRVIDFAQSVHQFLEYIKHIPTYITGSWLGYGKSKMINKEKLYAAKPLLNEPKSLELLNFLVNFRLNSRLKHMSIQIRQPNIFLMILTFFLTSKNWGLLMRGLMSEIPYQPY